MIELFWYYTFPNICCRYKQYLLQPQDFFSHGEIKIDFFYYSQIPNDFTQCFHESLYNLDTSMLPSTLR